jgi:nucleoside-diphosphate-sugar epimerase
MIKGKKILVTGATGQVARPIAESLAKHNEVWGAARFSDSASKTELESAGIKTVKWTLGSGEFDGLPNDFTYVIHSAANILPLATDYDAAIACNAEGTGLLMQHCRKAKAFLHISSLIVYKRPKDASDLSEERTASLGCNSSSAKTYSIMKICSEATVRTMARALSLPTTIARLGMVYGTSGHGGVPTIFLKKMIAGQPLLRSTRKLYYSPIAETDVVTHVEPLLGVASVPASIINWSSDEVIERQELYDYLSELSGLKPVYIDDNPENGDIGGLPDVTRLKAIAGPCRVKWRAGALKTLRVNFPTYEFRELAQSQSG